MIISLRHEAGWQNSTRELMGLEPVDTAHPLEVSLIALVVFAILITLARFFRMTIRFVATRANRLLPGRVSGVVGVIAAVALFWAIFNGVLFRAALRAAEASFQEYDALIEPEREPPTDPLRAGSSASLLAWDKLGRAGRQFISSGPTREDISAFTGRAALQPVRVYVGLRSADVALAHRSSQSRIARLAHMRVGKIATRTHHLGKELKAILPTRRNDDPRGHCADFPC